MDLQETMVYLFLILGAAPYNSLQVADVGDVKMNQYNLPEAVKDIKAAFSKLIENGCKTLAVGGDHTITYPILQAYKVSAFYSSATGSVSGSTVISRV